MLGTAVHGKLHGEGKGPYQATDPDSGLAPWYVLGVIAAHGEFIAGWTRWKGTPCARVAFRL